MVLFVQKNIFYCSSSLVTYPLKSLKTVVALLRQEQKVFLLLHTSKNQWWQLLSVGIKKGLRQCCRSWQYYRNPLISRHLMYFYPLTRDIKTTHSTWHEKTKLLIHTPRWYRETCPLPLPVRNSGARNMSTILPVRQEHVNRFR